MHSFPLPHRLRLIIFALLGFGFASAALAQESNVLGLTAVPQIKPGSAAAKSAARPASRSEAAAAKNPVNAPTVRDALTGELGLQHSALEGLGRLIITTRSSFVTADAKSSALDAALAVQRDLVQACGKQCKPVKMTAPKILSSGQLEFELAFRPLYQHLSQAQFVALLHSNPLNLTPAQLAAPAAASPAHASAAASTKTNTSKPAQ